MTTPEAKARIDIDEALQAAGWQVQNQAGMNISAGPGVAIREFSLKSGHGTADYLLYVDGRPAGVVEAKKVGATLTGVEIQSEKYSTGLPDALDAPVEPLPFIYQSTGVETRFTNTLEPDARSRRVFNFHRPETLAGWLGLRPSVALSSGGHLHASGVPSPMRSRLHVMPELVTTGMRRAQITAITNLEESLAHNRPRSLIQMATGSGKTYMAISSIYRLLKHGGAHRVLFLVDRGNLGRQALKEFQGYVTPDDGRKFTELYHVQHLTSNKIDPSARVIISTIQRLYSILRGEEEHTSEFDEMSAYEASPLDQKPVDVAYNPALPVEFFDVIFTDEAHRSIYNLWAQALNYFDSFLVGLTATPSKQTFGFFDQNLVMEYNHTQAVADKVNVDFDVYRIRTKISESGSSIESGYEIEKRDRETRQQRWEKLDDQVDYGAEKLDRDVVARDQLRTVIRTFKEKLFTEIYPGRTEVPKTLIYAKDDSHADDVVQIVREEFGKGNDFAQKITYKTGTARVVETVTGDDGTEKEQVRYKSSGLRAEDLISSFRNSYNPRVAVTVDMIATGTDIKPLEIVMFMRSVKSRTFFEQMKGRGVRTINADDLKGVTPDAPPKDRFVIVDCVGVTETDLVDSKPLERDKTVPFSKLLDLVAAGSRDSDVASTVAGRLIRLDTQISPTQREQLQKLGGGASVQEIAQSIVDALDPDAQIEKARNDNALAHDQIPTDVQVANASKQLIGGALQPLLSNPGLREELLRVRRSLDQLIDHISKDEVLEATYSKDATDRARQTVESFEKFIEENKDEITALQVIYNQPHGQRLTTKEIREFAAVIQEPPRNWSPESLWKAYEALDESKKVQAGGGRLLGDIAALIRYAIHRDDELVPFSDVVDERFQVWIDQQKAQGQEFTPQQLRWLEMIKNTIAANMGFEFSDFELPPFSQEGGPGAAVQILGTNVGDTVALLSAALRAVN